MKALIKHGWVADVRWKDLLLKLAAPTVSPSDRFAYTHTLSYMAGCAMYLLVETAFPWWRHYPDWKRDLGAYHLSSGLECTVVDPGKDRIDFEVAMAIGVPLFYSRTVMGGSAQRFHPLVFLLLYVLWNAFLYVAISAGATVIAVMWHRVRSSKTP